MAYELTLSFPSDTLVVGCEVVPDVRLFRTDSGRTAPHHFVFNWCRLGSDEPAKCCIHNSMNATFQCLCCIRLNLPVHKSYFCSSKCFLDSWPHHQVRHDQVCVQSECQYNIGVCKKSVLDKIPEDKYYLDSLLDDPNTIIGMHNKPWVNMGSSETYTPEKRDVGCLLRLECIVLDSETEDVLVPHTSIESSRVIVAPEPHPRNMIRNIQMNGLENSKSMPSVSGEFRVLSYNILADIYVMHGAFNYCPTWALIWQYRRQRLLNEIIGYRADIICLQEVQSNHFEEFFKPELEKNGYSVIYKGKTSTQFIGKEVREGCAIFYRCDRFHEIENYKLEFRTVAREMVVKLPENLKRTAAYRMIKDNVALIVVLELKENVSVSHAAASRYSNSICVVNVHVHANPQETDTKIFQVKSLLETLEKKYANAHMPILICADLNSLPGSVPYNLVVMGKAGKDHAELQVDPTGIISTLKLSHNLPRLASTYPSFFRKNSGDMSTGLRLLCLPYNEPCFTNFTTNFRGTIDYIFYTAESLICESVLELLDQETARVHGALPSPIWPSDHIAIMATFRRKLKV